MELLNVKSINRIDVLSVWMNYSNMFNRLLYIASPILYLLRLLCDIFRSLVPSCIALQCVDWDVKPYSLAHSIFHYFLFLIISLNLSMLLHH